MKKIKLIATLAILLLLVVSAHTIQAAETSPYAP